VVNISSNLQLVPYHHRPSQDAFDVPKPARPNQADGNPAAKQYVPMLSPPISRHANLPDGYESILHHNRCSRTQKINQVGLLIDIYA
jgi:hypothetical protein